LKVLSFILVVILIVGLLVGVIIYTNQNQDTKNTAEGQAEAGQLIISEIMASNKSVLPDEKGNYPDWIEVYNPGDKAINLSNYGLSDDEKSYAKWVFPNVELKAKGYFVVFCSGKESADVTTQSYHTNFKLSAAGETIYLSSSSGELVESVKYDALEANQTFGRASDGKLAVLKYATPGYPNTEKGYNSFVKSMTVKDSPLKITEVMTSNNTTVTDDQGAYSDWVEIYNSGDKAVSLKGYGLSDDKTEHLKWTFPDISIDAGEYLVIWASGDGNTSAKDPKAGLHTNFRLSSYEEYVSLANARGLLIDEVSVPTIESDKSYARAVKDDGSPGDFEITNMPTPGQVNNEDGYKEYEKKDTASLAAGDIMINEVMTSNSQYAPEDNGVSYDYIELYNKGSKTVDLAGYGLTDNTANPAKWKFGDVSIEPGHYLLVMASGLANDDSVKKKYIHTNFKLSAQGEILALYDDQGKLLDRYNLPNLENGLSVGRNEEAGILLYYTDPTPGEKNAAGKEGYTGKPVFNTQGGIYDKAVTVSISTDEQGTEVYYTLDGSVPDSSDKKYTGPLTIDSDKVLRACAYRTDYIPSKVTTETYLIGEKHTLPVVSISTEPAGLFDEQTGLYMPGPNAAAEFPQTGANWFKDTELPATFEMIENGKTTYVQDLGLSMYGSYSRGLPQKSFALKANSKYGQSWINYPVFGNDGFKDYSFDSYKSIVLRSGGQDSNISKIREIPAVEVMAPYIDVQNYRAVVVYINGTYWGTYGIREKINKNFLAQHHNIEDPDKICILAANGSIASGEETELNLWGKQDYADMIEYMKTHNLSDQDNFNHVASIMDTDNYMDFIIAQTYVTNSDAGNIKFWKERTDGGKWRWVFYDLDWGLMKAGRDGVADWLNPNGVGVGDMFSTQVFRSLLQNAKWKEKFLERYAYHLKNTFSAKRMLELVNKYAAQIESEMPREKEKFGGSVDNWKANIDRLRYFVENRPEVLVYQIRKAFDLSESKTKELFGTLGRAPNEKELAEL